VNKEWHENIPENGVLCKDDNGDTQLITEAKGIFGFRGLDYGYPLSKLTPLTAEEWWKFAPWQGMDSAPRDGSLILIMTDKSSCIGYYSDGFFIADTNDCEILSPIKWLPLPNQ